MLRDKHGGSFGASEIFGSPETFFLTNGFGTCEALHMLRDYRKSKGWTLEKAAKRFGLSLSYLSELETGAMPMTLAAAKKIAAKSDLSIIELLGLKERA
jgi:DNA-binding XRE family transcriptional regulator